MMWIIGWVPILFGVFLIGISIFDDNPQDAGRVFAFLAGVAFISLPFVASAHLLQRQYGFESLELRGNRVTFKRTFENSETTRSFSRRSIRNLHVVVDTNLPESYHWQNLKQNDPIFRPRWSTSYPSGGAPYVTWIRMETDDGTIDFAWGLWQRNALKFINYLVESGVVSKEQTAPTENNTNYFPRRSAKSQ